MEASTTVAGEEARDNTDTAATSARDHLSKQKPATKKHKRLGLVLKDRYRIEALIASGGMSDVYKAVDRHLEQAGARDCMVAVKILRNELTRDANALSLLAREAAKSKRLSHPNIIRVHDLDHDGETWFMVMELLDGEPLSRIIQRAKPHGLKWQGGRAVLQQVVSALAFSHRRGIIHADLKPSNIFFTRDGEIKLLDFGVAQALKPNQHVDFLNPHNDDETTIYGYTPAYASPALIAGKDPTVLDDLYALACIAYELFSSRHPFDRKKLSQEELASYPLSKPRNMPGSLWRVCRSLLKHQQPPKDLAAFQIALRPLPWPKYLYPAALILTILLALGAGYRGYTEAEAAKARLDGYANHEQRLQTLEQLPPADLLASLEGLSALEQAGFLKLHQEPILEHFRERTDQALQSQSRPNLPNIPAALDVINEARSLFPHDFELIRQGEQLSQRSLSLQSALGEELQGRLAQGDYRDYTTQRELKELAADLSFLGGSLPVPGEEAIRVFARQLTTALDKDDGPALDRLLGVGDLFFADLPQLAESLGAARQLENAIETLGRYHEAVADGQTPTYPIDAAEQFYAQRLEHWGQTIANAKRSSNLDSVFNDLASRQTKVPVDFPPFAAIRQRLADAYLSQADALLARGQTRQAQPLLQKATSLMRQGDKN